MGLYRKFVRLFALALQVAVLSWALQAKGSEDRSQDGLTPSNRHWNGLSLLSEHIRHRGFHLSVPSILVPESIDSHTLILAVDPQCSLDEPILAFVRRGGWLLVADETGRLQSFWKKLDIRLRPSSRLGPALHAARVHGGHPLTRGLKQLWTNRPGVFNRVRGRVLADMGSRDKALLLETRLGRGKILALSDPSIFINLMLEYEADRTFLGNLLDWAAAAGKSHIVLLAGRCRVRRVAHRSDDWITMLRSAAKRLDNLRPGPDLLFVVAVLLMGTLLAALAWKLPLGKGTYRKTWVEAPSAPDRTGFAAVVRGYEQGSIRDYAQPAIQLREEIDRILARRLDLPAPLFETRPSNRSLSKHMNEALRGNFVRLHRLCAKLPTQPGTRPVSRRQFLKILSLATRLLEGLGEEPAWLQRQASCKDSQSR